MRKHLIAISLILILFGCAKEHEETTRKTDGENFSLSVYNADSLAQTSILDTMCVFYFTPNPQAGEPEYYQQDSRWTSPLSIENLTSPEYTFIVVAGEREILENTHLSFYDQCLRVSGYSFPSENLFGGMITVNGNEIPGELKLERLVGGVKVDVTFLDTAFLMHGYDVQLLNVLNDFYFGDPQGNQYTQNVWVGGPDTWTYLLPTQGPVRGTIRIYGSNEEGMQTYYQYEFVSKHAVEANKKLELSFTLNKPVPSKSAGTATPSFSLEERVTNF